MPAAAYIEVIRDSPILMQLYVIFFALPILLKIEVPVFWAGVAALVINGSAFMAEIVRAGIQSVGRDQWEAARSLGMGYLQIMRWIVLPPGPAGDDPPGVGLFIGLVKDSSVVSVLSYIELTRAGQILMEKTFLSLPGVRDRGCALLRHLLPSLASRPLLGAEAQARWLRSATSTSTSAGCTSSTT